MAQLNKRSFVTSSDAQTLVNRATRNVYLKLAETLTRGEIDELIRFELGALDYITTDEMTAAIDEAIENIMTSETTSLSSYSTTDEMNAAIAEAIEAALE